MNDEIESGKPKPKTLNAQCRPVALPPPPDLDASSMQAADVDISEVVVHLYEHYVPLKDAPCLGNPNSSAPQFSPSRDSHATSSLTGERLLSI